MSKQAHARLDAENKTKSHQSVKDVKICSAEVFKFQQACFPLKGFFYELFPLPQTDNYQVTITLRTHRIFIITRRNLLFLHPAETICEWFIIVLDEIRSFFSPH